MRERFFRFKQFGVNHSQSAMKVGIDGILLGAWCDVSNAVTILDVGCGCGLISLMCAQRNDRAEVVGVDIDAASVNECRENFNNSPWRTRLTAVCADANSDDFLKASGKFDLIVSNPPYYESGISISDNPRERARHVGTLSPYSVIDISLTALSSRGIVAMIVPSEFIDTYTDYAKKSGLFPQRLTFIRHNNSRDIKRCLVEFSYRETVPVENVITLYGENGETTENFRNLCSDFYLSMH